MADLRLTPRRLSLLRAVAAGEVRYWPSWRPKSSPWSEVKTAGHVATRVTTRIQELEGAGLVRLGHRSHPSLMASRPWELTDAGRAVLAENDTTEAGDDR